MTKIRKAEPPPHIIVIDTNVLWWEDKTIVVNPDFDSFWSTFAESFPMKLIVPEAVYGELLFQQTTSALKHLEKANQEIAAIQGITGKKYTHRLTDEKIRTQVKERLDEWCGGKTAVIHQTPIAAIDWKSVIDSALWRRLPFTPDPKNPKNEKGFRDCLILETVAAICAVNTRNENVAFICNDYALRTAADSRLSKMKSYASYDSIKGFESFIELTRKNLTDSFVKSILFRARSKFHDEESTDSLIYRDGFLRTLRAKYAEKIDKAPDNDFLYGLLSSARRSWVPQNAEQVWITRPQFDRLEGKAIYHWISKVTFVRLFEREKSYDGEVASLADKRLMVLGIAVKWRSEVRADGRFFDCSISSHDEVEYKCETPTPEELERYGIQHEPNKAPEPTPGADTPRATEGGSK